MVANGLHFVRRNERTWHYRCPDERSPFRAGRLSNSAEGLSGVLGPTEGRRKELARSEPSGAGRSCPSRSKSPKARWVDGSGETRTSSPKILAAQKPLKSFWSVLQVDDY